MFAARRKAFHRFCNSFTLSQTPNGLCVMCRIPLPAPRDHTTVVLALHRHILLHIRVVYHCIISLTSHLPPNTATDSHRYNAISAACCTGGRLESRVLNSGTNNPEWLLPVKKQAQTLLCTCSSQIISFSSNYFLTLVLLSSLGVVYLLYMLYFMMSCVYCCHLMCICCTMFVLLFLLYMPNC